jgi:hypothetical protein
MILYLDKRDYIQEEVIVRIVVGLITLGVSICCAVPSVSVATEFKQFRIPVSPEEIQRRITTPEYLDSVFPYDLGFVIQLLEHGKNMPYGTLYARSVLKLFANMAKRSPFIHADSVELLLKELPLLLAPYCTEQIVLRHPLAQSQYHPELYDVLLSAFSAEYESFQEAPDHFLQQLSTTIGNKQFAMTETMQLQHHFVRFLESIFAKLIWNPEQCAQGWQQVKKMAQTIADLSDKKLLQDPNDLDDLLWSLISRYATYLQLCADVLPQQFFAQIKKELENESSPLFLFDIIHDSAGKRAHLQRVVAECELRSVNII